MSWCVYLLECNDDTLYCGITNNLDRRIETHNAGRGAKYTRIRVPVKLVYSEHADDRSFASKREYQIKKLTRSKKLELISRKVVPNGKGPDC